MGLGPEGGFVAAGLVREHWSSADPIRRIFRDAYERAGLPYFKPHAIRDTIVQLGERTCPNPEAFKSWSQNMGHDKVLTTLTSYGAVAPHRQAEIIRALGAPRVAALGGTLEERVAVIVRQLGIEAGRPAD